MRVNFLLVCPKFCIIATLPELPSIFSNPPFRLCYTLLFSMSWYSWNIHKIRFILWSENFLFSSSAADVSSGSFSISLCFSRILSIFQNVLDDFEFSEYSKRELDISKGKISFRVLNGFPMRKPRLVLTVGGRCQSGYGKKKSRRLVVLNANLIILWVRLTLRGNAVSRESFWWRVRLLGVLGRDAFDFLMFSSWF